MVCHMLTWTSQDFQWGDNDKELSTKLEKQERSKPLLEVLAETSSKPP